MDTEPRRVNFEREQEWITIKQSISERARRHTAVILEESGLGDDSDARRELEELIGRKLQHAFQLCVSNLQVNGYEYEDYLELTEPFNEPLDRALWSLSASKVEHAQGTAAKRRTVPKNVMDNEMALERAREGGEWLGGDLPERVEGDVTGAEVSAPERHEETVQTFQTALAQLQQLSKTVPSLVTRAERAKLVQEQVQALPA